MLPPLLPFPIPKTLEKISQDYPGSIVKEGGLSAILQYLDFFNIHIQRTAMTAAANCCRKLSTESFNMVKDVMPIIQNVLTYSDQRLVESACKCVVRVVESYKHHPSFLERLLSEELLAGVNSLLLPSSGSSGGSGGSSTTVGAAVYTDMLKALSSAARASAKVAVSLLENNIVETLYHLLTGSPAPPEDASSGSTSLASAQGSPQTGKLELAATLADPSSATAEGIVAVADVAILQNLAQRPKEQVQEALSLVGELLPPLPRDGVFDAKAYSERAYLKRKSKESKSAKLAKDGTTIKAGSSSSSSSSKVQIKSESNAESGTESSRASPEASVSGGADSTPTDVGHSPSSKPERTKSEREIAKESAHAKRVEMLKAHSKLVNRFTQLVLPTLVEVYAASVALHVRSKAISGILKIVSFVEPEPLAKVLDRVPLASFVAAILSSRDHPSLVHGALQLVELLTIKLPDVYKALLRREGVIWEIEDIASKDPKTSMHAGKSKKPDDGTKVKPEPQPLSLPGRGGRTTSAAPPGATDQSPVESGSSMAASSGLARLLAATSGAEGGGGGLPNNVFSSLSGTTNAASSRSTGTLLSDAEDANIWRARVLRDRFAQEAASSEGARKAAKTLDDIKELVSRLSTEAESDEQKAREIIQMLTSLFSAQDEPISSFELLRSGLVEGLYSFATKSSDGVPLEKRRSMLIESLMMADPSNNTAASVLVRRLQELLSRLENVEITTAINSGTEDSRRSPTSMLGRQIRLRLQAEDGAEVPRTCTNVVVTIHAIATFQSLNDYLRPKIAASAALSSSGNGGSSGSMSSRLSGVLAAFAAATGGAGLPDLPGLGESSTGRPSENSGSRVDPSSKSKDSGSDSPSGSKDKKDQEEDKEKGKQRGKESAGPSRRRSSRLSGKGADEGKGQDSAAEEKKDKEEDEEEGRSIEQAAARELLASAGLSAGDESDEALARRLMEGLLQGSGLEEDGYSDEEFDEEILENELPAGPADGQGGNGDADKTINLDVAQDGSKVIAKTPEGTRVASPSHGSPGPSSQRAESSSAPSPSKRSYASALQKKPSDWHLEFSMGDQKLSLGTTIYGAVHNFEMSAARSGGGGGGGAAFGGQQRYIWGNIYTVKYRKVQGPLPTEASNSTPEPPDNSYPTVTLPPSVEPEAPYAKLLQLLAVLHDLNAEWRELCRLEFGRVSTRAPAMSEAAFVNNKLTAKLNRQLEEPMIVASACMPPWSTDLPKVFPFLFPFEVRFAFLQSTAFGYARLITRWQNLHSRNQDNSSSSSMRPDDSFGFLGRLQRQKVRISRANLLQSAFKVFELYGSNSSVLEVEYFEEIGTGLGPTLEFYSLVSKEFARKDLDLWRDNSSDSTGSEYVFSPQGLFPAPISEKEAETAEGKKRIHAFKILGQFVAKALLDSRIIDCNFSPVFMRAVLNEMMPANMNTMTAVDPALAKSLKGLLEMKRDEVGSLGLDFTAPGYPSYELHPDGKDDEVDAANLEQYVTEVLEATLGKGIKPMVRAFRQGFNLIFPISAMSSFTADELVTLFGNTEEDWSEATLMGAIKPDHGLTSESASFKDIISIMSEFDPKERREFLQWMTGSPKLPIGGFAGLHPPLTIVRRAIEPPADPDSFLASCTTCVNFLKLPQYSSREIMRKKLMFAIREGRDSFHLS
ncbi:hypothetical protein IE53DRAFT_309085 [Violaceomyces palustris]|uniref:Uncharacterized protein n=1 Tax=Violaceomyces palustris TaxID=1673888 RepID=A0ACD0P7R5_9BASI|nr:hypothetical protein IE53DRAFT_309085 [Violaceomyces palustris]